MSIEDFEPHPIQFDEKDRMIVGTGEGLRPNGHTHSYDPWCKGECLHELSDPLSINPSVIPLAEAL